MANWNLLLMLGALITAALSASLPKSQHAMHRRSSKQLAQPVRLCGKELANFLTLECEPYGGLNGPSNTHQSPSSVRNRSGRRIGIVDECCLQPCTYRTLLSYCANFTLHENASSGQDEEVLDNRLIDLLFGPTVPSPPRRNKPAGCARRCRLQCKKQIALQDKSLEGNSRSNYIQVGTVPPVLGRPLVVIHPRRH